MKVLAAFAAGRRIGENSLFVPTRHSQQRRDDFESHAFEKRDKLNRPCALNNLQANWFGRVSKACTADRTVCWLD